MVRRFVQVPLHSELATFPHPLFLAPNAFRMAFDQFMNELRELPIGIRPIRLNAAGMGPQKTHDPAVVLGDLDERIDAEKNLNPLVAMLPVAFDDNTADFRHGATPFATYRCSKYSSRNCW